MKRFVAILIVFSTLFSFTGCSNEQQQETEYIENTEYVEEISSTEEANTASSAVFDEDHPNTYKQLYYENDMYTGYYALICMDCHAVVQDNLYELCEHEWGKPGSVYIDDELFYELRFCELCRSKEVTFDVQKEEFSCLNGGGHYWAQYKNATDDIVKYVTIECKWCHENEIIFNSEEGTSSCQNGGEHFWMKSTSFSNGEKWREEWCCRICGTTEVLIDLFDNTCEHEWEEWEDYNENGVLISAGRYCSLCDNYEQTYQCEHNWDNYEEYNESGDVLLYAYNVCSWCGETETTYNYSDYCDHVFYEDISVEAEYIFNTTICEICGRIESTHSIENPCDHEWEVSEEYDEYEKGTWILDHCVLCDAKMYNDFVAEEDKAGIELPFTGSEDNKKGDNWLERIWNKLAFWKTSPDECNHNIATKYDNKKYAAYCACSTYTILNLSYEEFSAILEIPKRENADEYTTIQYSKYVAYNKMLNPTVMEFLLTTDTVIEDENKRTKLSEMTGALSSLTEKISSASEFDDAILRGVPKISSDFFQEVSDYFGAASTTLSIFKAGVDFVNFAELTSNDGDRSERVTALVELIKNITDNIPLYNKYFEMALNTIAESYVAVNEGEKLKLVRYAVLDASLNEKSNIQTIKDYEKMQERRDWEEGPTLAQLAEAGLTKSEIAVLTPYIEFRINYELEEIMGRTLEEIAEDHIDN